MSEDNYQNSVARRKLVQRLKKIIVLLLFISILIPIICCIVLFVQVHSLNVRLDSLEYQLEKLTQTTTEQQQWIQKWMEGNQTLGQGEAVQGRTSAMSVKANEVTADEKDVSIDGTEQEQQHKVYLTFDDGPSIYTDEILDVLARYDVKATFFVVGKEGEKPKAALRRIAEEGHSIGLHSYSHEYSTIYASKEAFAEDYQKVQDYVYQVTGLKSNIYRFPGGSSNTVSDLEMYEFAQYLEEQGIEFFDWNIASGDGESRLLDVETLVENATLGIENRDTSIILLHDAADKHTTVEALPIIIENILAMEDTVILPITEDTKPIHHIDMKVNK